MGSECRECSSPIEEEDEVDLCGACQEPDDIRAEIATAWATAKSAATAEMMYMGQVKALRTAIAAFLIDHPEHDHTGTGLRAALKEPA